MIPVVTCCSVDEVLRSAVAGGLLLDLPGAVVIRHDIDHRAGTLRRHVHDVDGTIEDRTSSLEHACLGCALRGDILPAVREIARRRPAAIVLALPVTAEPVPVVRALVELGDEGVVRVGGVVTALAVEDLAWDLCGDDLLSERGLALSEDDERSLGEVIAHQIEGCDLIVTDGSADEVGAALIAHLSRPGTAHSAVHELDVPSLLAPRSRVDLLHRGDPLMAAAGEAEGSAGVGTVTLESWRPFHPERLLSNLESLGGRPGRSRGVFWLPTRPHTVCQWEGAGGQLSLGALSTWDDAGRDACTRLVVTSLDDDRDEITEVFRRTLLTDAELAAGLGPWAGREDGYDPWLGARHGTA